MEGEKEGEGVGLGEEGGVDAEEGGREGKRGGKRGTEGGGRGRVGEALMERLRARRCRQRRTLGLRQEVREALVGTWGEGGGVARVMELLQRERPRLWATRVSLRFDLYCLAFVDLLRGGRVPEALAWARERLLGFAVKGEEEGGEEGPRGEGGALPGGRAEERTGRRDGEMEEGNGASGGAVKGRKPPRQEHGSQARMEGPGRPSKPMKRPWGPKTAALSPRQAASRSLDFARQLRDITGLLAYFPDMEASPLGHLVGQGHREEVAERVNAAILMDGEEKGEEEVDEEDRSRSLLEQTLLGLAAMHDMVGEIRSGGRGEAFRLPALSRMHNA
jgi:hypothetical protein